MSEYKIKIYRQLRTFGVNWLLISPWEWVLCKEYGDWYSSQWVSHYSWSYDYHDTEFQAVVAAYLIQKNGGDYIYIEPTFKGRTEEEIEDIKLIQEYRKKYKNDYFPDIEFLRFIKKNNLTNYDLDSIITLWGLVKGE
jgi:hypothetical protein